MLNIRIGLYMAKRVFVRLVIESGAIGVVGRGGNGGNGSNSGNGKIGKKRWARYAYSYN